MNPLTVFRQCFCYRDFFHDLFPEKHFWHKCLSATCLVTSLYEEEAEVHNKWSMVGIPISPYTEAKSKYAMPAGILTFQTP